MSIENVLLDLGLGISSNAIYDAAKSYLTRTKTPTVEGLTKQIASQLSIDGASIAAATIVQFLAKNGNISITRTGVKANDRITMASFAGTELRFGDDSVSETSNSRIEAGRGAEIRMQGGAKIVQNEDGSIDFFV